MNAIQEIRIDVSRHEETAWKRYIRFTYEGESYELTLFWDQFDGYEIMWREPSKAPQWVIEWDEEAHNGDSFEAYLDELTWEMK